MSFRFRRRVTIIPGVRLNFGKRGTSVSIGHRGFWYTIGPRGRGTTIGLPGTGISWTQHYPRRSARIVKQQLIGGNSPRRVDARLVGFALLVLFAVFLFDRLHSLVSNWSSVAVAPSNGPVQTVLESQVERPVASEPPAGKNLPGVDPQTTSSVPVDRAKHVESPTSVIPGIHKKKSRETRAAMSAATASNPHSNHAQRSP